VAPIVERFAPTWALISAGYDGHRADPLTGLGLSAGDFADFTQRIRAFAPPARTIAFLEGGYDLDALRDGVAATVTTLLDAPVRPESATAGGPGHTVVRAAADLHLR
jgi:acetoin utilization deacetylase AcuC-like enzyme